MPVLIKVYGSNGLRGCCDGRCYDAITKRCRCCCGGVNHGVGLNKAIGNIARMYKAQVAANCGGPFGELEVVMPKVEPALFPEVIG